MKKHALFLCIVLAIVFGVAACGGATEEETKGNGVMTVTPEPTATPEPTVTPESTATPEPTA
ncbi:MAG: SH3 domain-containing protein, partial [Lachnospiraceae bacterium]|nr:SH3 domain-containing protein [Lachnospiraceae bacterium]